MTEEQIEFVLECFRIRTMTLEAALGTYKPNSKAKAFVQGQISESMALEAVFINCLREIGLR
jgi:hypothetical protein